MSQYGRYIALTACAFAAIAADAAFAQLLPGAQHHARRAVLKRAAARSSRALSRAS